MPDLIRVELDRRDLARLTRVLGAAGAARTLKPPMTRALARLQRDLADYPPPARKPQPAKTRRQQIKQILLAREGKIPYRRTGALGRGWRGVVDTDAGGVEGRLTNDVSYGPLVESAEDQADYHKGVWPTDAGAAARHTRAIIDDFNDAIEDALGGR